jgi:hypothetical protein
MLFLYDLKSGEISQMMDFATADRIAQMKAQGVGVLEVGNSPLDNYVDLSKPATPVLTMRPTIDAVPSVPNPVILQETVLPSVPAGDYAVTGPSNSTITHPGGNLSLKFGLPGTYVIRFNKFPYRYTEWTIAVSVAKATVAVGATTTEVKV